MLAAYTCSLRVFVPLFAMEGGKARRWSSYVRRQQTRPADASNPLDEERSDLLQAIIREGVNFGKIDMPERALTASWRGDTVVCPLDSRSRALQAIVESEWKLPFPLNDYVLDRTARRHASRLQLEPSFIQESAESHILTASWQVPFWWSLLFEETDAVSSAGRTPSRFRTAIKTALDRGRAAQELIAESFGDGEFTADLEFVLSWLGQHTLDSMIELDFTSLVNLTGVAAAPGSTVDGARRALEYLEAEEFDDALAAYHEYMSIWEEAARLENFN